MPSVVADAACRAHKQMHSTSRVSSTRGSLSPMSSRAFLPVWHLSWSSRTSFFPTSCSTQAIWSCLLPFPLACSVLRSRRPTETQVVSSVRLMVSHPPHPTTTSCVRLRARTCCLEPFRRLHGYRWLLWTCTCTRFGTRIGCQPVPGWHMFLGGSFLLRSR